MTCCMNEALQIENHALRDILRKTSWHKELLRRLHARCPDCISIGEADCTNGGEITESCLDCPHAIWNK